MLGSETLSGNQHGQHLQYLASLPMRGLLATRPVVCGAACAIAIIAIVACLYYEKVPKMWMSIVTAKAAREDGQILVQMVMLLVARGELCYVFNQKGSWAIVPDKITAVFENEPPALVNVYHDFRYQCLVPIAVGTEFMLSTAIPEKCLKVRAPNRLLIDFPGTESIEVAVQ